MTPFEVIALLKAARVHHELASTRDGAITVVAAVPGERWEIEVFDDGHIEIERFRSDGEITDETALVTLLARFSDTQ